MLKIHHIGYAVKRLNQAKRQMDEMGFQFGSLIEDKERKIQIAFGEKDGYRIELVMPMKKGSPIDQILANIGPTPYHICYETDCLEKAVEQLTCGGGGIA